MKVKRRFRLLPLILATMFCIFLGGCWGAKSRIEIVPDRTEGTDILPDTSFTVRTEADVTPAQLRELLRFEPGKSYHVEQLEDGGFSVRPTGGFAPDSEAAVRYGDQVFRFHVANRLTVRACFPAEGSERVPTNTGIEILFNQPEVSLQMVDRAVTVDPPVSLRIGGGWDNGRFSFYPEEDLKPDTRYTVTVNPPLTSQSGAELAEPFHFSFTAVSPQQTMAEQKFRISGTATSINTLTDEPPFLEVYLDEDAVMVEEEPKASVTVYRFDGWEPYYEHLLGLQQAQNNYYKQAPSTLLLDTGGLEQAAQFEAALVQGNSNWATTRLLLFPEPLPEGWYLAEIGLEVDGFPLKRQILVQSSDLSVFFMRMSDDLVLWLNDAATGGPVADASFEMAGSFAASGRTDADGVLHIPDGQLQLERGSTWDGVMSGEENSIFRITAGDRTFIDASFLYSDQTVKTTEYDPRDYYSYLYCDRPIYRTTDTVRVWGVVRPRDPAVGMPEEVTVRLLDGEAEQAVQPQKNGTFTASLSFSGLRSNDWGWLELWLGDTSLCNTSLRVEDFVKPVYTTEAYTDRPIYLSEENPSVQVIVDVATFDGTPASNLAVNISGNSEGLADTDSENTVVLTDAQGRAVSNKLILADENSWRPQSYYYSVDNADAESESFSYWQWVQVIHRDLMLQPRKIADGQVEVSANRIDLSRVTSAEQAGDVELLRGAPVSCEAEAEIHRVYFEAEKTGSYYDHISHTRKDTFSYQQRDEITETRILRIENGVGKLTELPSKGQNDYYYLLVRAQDSHGKPVEETCMLTAGVYRYQNENGEHRYMFERLPGPDTEITDYYQAWQNEFQDGETVTFQLSDNDQPVESMTGRVLYSLAQKEFGQPVVTDQGHITLPFSESLLPSYAVAGGYFDGKHIYALQTNQMRFDPARRELEITLTPDQESYQPGDPVALEARVVNKQTGTPAGNAAIALGVADEAVFAMQEQYVNLLDGYYSWTDHYAYVQTYTSYEQKNYGGGHEKGGGGGQNPRKAFEDTAWFGAEETDSEGKATFRFTLPDNVTSWRTTALALTDDGQAGNTRSAVSATLPYFLNPIVNRTLLEGDDLSVSLRSTGTGIAAEDPVSYTAEVFRADGSEAGLAPVEAEAAAGVYTNLLFDGKLSAGAYFVRLSGSCGTYADAVELPFTVERTGVETAQIRQFDLKDGIQIDALRYPVTIQFYDGENKTIHEVWSNLRSWSEGMRTDQQLVRYYLARAQKAQGADYSKEDLDAFELGGYYGMLSVLPHMELDEWFTLRVYLAFPDLFNQKEFARNLNDSGCSPMSYCAMQALSGFSNARMVEDFLKSEHNLTLTDRLYLGCVLAELEETQAAKELYDTLVTPALIPFEGVSGEKALALAAPEGSGLQQVECTAAASMLASALHLPDAEGLTRYLLEKGSPYEPYLIEQLYYLGKFRSAEKRTVSFSYQKDGKRETIDLSNGEQRFLSFTKEQLEKAAFQVESGLVQADVSYIGGQEQLDPSSRRIGLTKTVEPVNGTFGQGELVRITLTPDFSGFDPNIGEIDVVIDDMIPAGMRYEKAQNDPLDLDASGWRGWTLDRREEQRVRFRAYGKYFFNRISPIVYYARCVTNGAYTVESAYINSLYNDTWGMSERSEVEIS